MKNFLKRVRNLESKIHIVDEETCRQREDDKVVSRYISFWCEIDKMRLGPEEFAKKDVEEAEKFVNEWYIPYLNMSEEEKAEYHRKKQEEDKVFAEECRAFFVSDEYKQLQEEYEVFKKRKLGLS